METFFAVLCVVVAASVVCGQDGCPYGRYGDACDKYCSFGCLQGKCHRNTGDCTQGCQFGQYGAKCDNWCPLGCQQPGCNSTTGKCLGGCVSGRWGLWCRKFCPAACRAPRVCDQSTGQCSED